MVKLSTCCTEASGSISWLAELNRTVGAGLLSLSVDMVTRVKEHQWSRNDRMWTKESSYAKVVWRGQRHRAFFFSMSQMAEAMGRWRGTAVAAGPVEGSLKLLAVVAADSGHAADGGQQAP